MTVLRQYNVQQIIDLQQQLDEAAVIIRTNQTLFEKAARDMEEKNKRIAELERITAGQHTLQDTQTELIRSLQADAEVGAMIRKLPRGSQYHHNYITGEIEIFVGDMNSINLICVHGVTPEEALAALYQVMKEDAK